MGVKDFRPLLKKHAPASITHFDSLASLRGSRIAIDGNLLLNKLQFSPTSSDPHQAEPHLMFKLYRFFKLLERAGKEPVMVLDGHGRVAAKSRELQRRRMAKEREWMRYAAEVARGELLREFVSVRESVSRARQEVSWSNGLPPMRQESQAPAVEECTSPIDDEGDPMPPPMVTSAQDVGSTARWTTGSTLLAGQTVHLTPPFADSTAEDLHTPSSSTLDVAEPSAVTPSSASPSPMPITTPSETSESVFIFSTPFCAAPASPKPSEGPHSTSIPSEPDTEVAETTTRPGDVSITSAKETREARGASQEVEREREVCKEDERTTGWMRLTVRVVATAFGKLVALSSASASRMYRRIGLLRVALEKGPASSPSETVAEPAAASPPPTPPPTPSTPSIEPPLTRNTPATSFVKAQVDATPSLVVDPLLDRLETLKLHFEQDVDNPIYSRNQTHLANRISGALSRDAPSSSRTTSAESPAETAPPFFPSVSLPVHDNGAGRREADMTDECETGGDDLLEELEVSQVLERRHWRQKERLPLSALHDTEILVNALGLPLIKPTPERPHEAEGLCSTLFHLGLVDYVSSEDLDVVVYGAPLLAKINIPRDPPHSAFGDSQEISTTGHMNLLDSRAAREQLDMTQDEFVDLALLCGTDFTERIPRLGPARAIKAIREHGSIEAYLASPGAKWLPEDSELYMRRIQDAREIFREPPPLPDGYSLERRAPSRHLSSLLRGWGVDTSEVEL